jgi:hypothetical protein
MIRSIFRLGESRRLVTTSWPYRLAPRRTDCRMRLACKGNRLKHCRLRRDSGWRPTIAFVPNCLVPNSWMRIPASIAAAKTQEGTSPSAKEAIAGPAQSPLMPPANPEDRRAGNQGQNRCLVSQADEARNRHRSGEHKCQTGIELTGNVEKTEHPGWIEHARKRKAEAEDHARSERRENSRSNVADKSVASRCLCRNRKFKNRYGI